MSNDEVLLADRHDRSRAETDIDHSWALSAGAGAGKTHTLIERLRTVLDRGLPADKRMVAITFTERAARDLVNKMRRDLGADLPMERMYVGTIHGFCLSVLRRFPLEAGLPPVFTAESELMAHVDAAERAARIRRAFFTAIERAAAAGNEAPRPALQVMVTCGAIQHFDLLVGAIERDWDRMRTTPLASPPSWRAAVAALDPLFDANFRRTFTDIGGPQFDEFLPALRALRQATSYVDAADIVFGPAKPPAKRGKAAQEVAARWADVEVAVSHVVLHTVAEVLVPIVLAEAEQRQRAGVISFDDILVLTRQLLVDRPAICRQLRAEIAHLCVDEFQDTDPVQYAIVRLLTDPDPAADGTAPAPMLFAVGDPKQSIYSFRNANVELFEDLLVSDHLEAGSLSVNFRSRPLILEWINRTFQSWFSHSKPKGQVHFEQLDAHVAEGPAAVRVLGSVFERSDEAAAAQADEIVATVLEAHGRWPVRPTHVAADDTDEDTRPARFGDIAILVRRRADLIALEPVLVQARVPFVIEGGTLRYETREIRDLLRVLRAVDDPSSAFNVVTALRTSVLAISDRELVEHRAVVGSSWDPMDRSVVGHPAVLGAFATLRRWIHARTFAPPHELFSTVAAESFSWAAANADQATQRATWRRLRTVIDEARDWFRQTGGSLNDYLAFVDGMVEEDERRNVTTDERDDDAVRILTVHAAKGLDFPVVIVAGLGFKLPAADHTRLDLRHGAVEIKVGRWLRTAGMAATPDDADKNAAANEAARLVYVACTRARDHLVVCTHSGKASSPNSAVAITPHIPAETERPLPGSLSVPAFDPPEVVELSHARPTPPPKRPPWALRSATPATSVELPTDVSDAPTAVGPRPSEATSEFIEPADPVEQSGAAPASEPWVLASASADEGALSVHSKPPRSAAALPEQVGRYGTVIGRAVHGVLQHVDLSDPHDGLAALVATQCAAEAVPEPFHPYVGHLVESVLASEVFAAMSAAAQTTTVRREMYVGGMVDGGGVYGIIDAIWETPDGFVVVDFKTDHARESDDTLRSRYTAQLWAYAGALTASTGRPVAALLLAVAVADGSPAVTVRIPPRPTLTV